MGEEVYCICRSSDASRFMIACDQCEEWYHGDCIKVTEREAKYIKSYFCKKCRAKNPKLEVKYKSKYKDKLDELKQKPSGSGGGSSQHRETEEERARRKAKERDRERDRHREGDRHKEDKKARRSRSRERKPDKQHGSRDKDDRKEKEKAPAKPFKREPLSDSSDEEVIRKDKKEDQKPVKTEALKHVKTETPEEPISHLKRDRSESLDTKPPHVKSEPVLKKAKVEVDSFDDDSPSDDDWKPSEAIAAQKKVTKNTVQKPVKTKPARSKKRRGRQRDDFSSSEDERVKLDGTSQCYNVTCRNGSRPGSKYCSDECGIQLAQYRIMSTLPERVGQWNLTQCVAEKSNQKELNKIRAKQDVVRNRLEQLTIEFQQLEDLIAQGKSQTVQDTDNEDENDEASVHCVTCGTDIHSKSAIRHMERCYNKMESKTSFASRYKTQIEDARMFCDFYNPKEDTYCKRLKVLCPEHNPDPKILDDEVCGSPLSSGQGFCRLSRKHCQAHYGWEKLRRAELDMERVKQWMKIDELLEQERQVKASMSNRAGLLAMLLHSTRNHDMEDMYQKQMQQQQQQQQQHRKQQPQQNPNSWNRSSK